MAESVKMPAVRPRYTLTASVNPNPNPKQDARGATPRPNPP